MYRAKFHAKTMCIASQPMRTTQQQYFHLASKTTLILVWRNRILASNINSTWCKVVSKCDNNELMNFMQFQEVIQQKKNKVYPWSLALHHQCCTHFFWNITIGSLRKSLMSMVAPFAFTSGCFRTNNHPMCAKKNPRFELCGSASVSVNLWWTLWSRTWTNFTFKMLPIS